jgi:xanthine dehydrogenase accessory factor
MDFLEKSTDLASRHVPFAVATVVRVTGSSSARPGSKAIIDPEGHIVLGWVGGGCAESVIRQSGMECIASGQPQLVTLDMTDEVLGVGMPCGGKMDVYVEPVLPKPDLLILGHGRIAETICALGRILHFSVTVDDPLATQESFPGADRLLKDDLDLSQAHIDSKTYVVIATQHKGDHLWLQKAIEGDAAYIALISSRHRATLVLDYVEANGVPREKLDRVWAPAGLDLGAQTPEEIALAIVSQIVALRRGGSGQALNQQALNQTEAHGESETEKMVTQCDAVPR